MIWVKTQQWDTWVSWQSYSPFWAISVLSSRVAVPVRIPTCSAWGSPFLYIRFKIRYFIFAFLNNLSLRYEVTFHCDFDLHFPRHQWCRTSFHVLLGSLWVFVEKKIVHLLIPPHWVSLILLLLNCMSPLSILGINSLSDTSSAIQ